MFILSPVHEHLALGPFVLVTVLDVVVPEVSVKVMANVLLDLIVISSVMGVCSRSPSTAYFLTNYGASTADFRMLFS